MRSTSKAWFLFAAAVGIAILLLLRNRVEEPKPAAGSTPAATAAERTVSSSSATSPSQPPEPVQPTQPSTAAGGVPAQAPNQPGQPVMPRTAPATATAPSAPSEESPESVALRTDLENVQVMLREFRSVVGENPVGTNAEIMRAILGDNVKQVKIGPPEGQHLNDKGELVDRWGHPYFFHQISESRMEIRSAGPDGVMWTGDDKQL